MEEILSTATEATVEIVDIQFRPGQKTYFFDPDGGSFAPGDHVVIDTARGAEYGTCVRGNHTISQEEVVAPLRKVIRRATPQDERVAAENQAREKRACDVCRQKITAHGLDMQLVRAECAFDGSKILFYFTADERVDFRELVKDLASAFHTRIELRQIGVRDKAKLVGGLGICGRLMCCLKYEQDTYESLIRSSPKAESFVDTPEGRGTITDVDVLRQRVKVRMEENPDTVSTFSVEDIAVLRSGKAKKNDPPIPADLAPISGGGKRVRKEPEPDAPVLESIRFRYSTEEVAQEVTAQPAPEEAKPRRRRKDRGENKAAREPREGKEPPKEVKETKEPKETKAAKDTPAQQPEAEPAGEGEKKPRRRPNYRHRRRPKAPQA